MSWNIAQAKQQFSELVRLSAQEPQAIYNRDRPVATVVNASEFEQFLLWRSQQTNSGLVKQFEFARQAFAAVTDEEPIPTADRLMIQRPNAFSTGD